MTNDTNKETIGAADLESVQGGTTNGQKLDPVTAYWTNVYGNLWGAFTNPPTAALGWWRFPGM